ncbi:MAG: 50S ribosomal protein L11 methyltransferase [Thermoleophilia bacterium]
MTVPAELGERAMAEACGLLGTGCREGRGPQGEVLLDFWVPADAADAAALRDGLAAAGIAARVEARAEDERWRHAMRAFHRPVEVAGRLRVRPPWADAGPGLLDVVIDPGMAFGTAQHATTRACLALLAGLGPPGSVLDAGCGSGVLSIAALRLGFRPVRAVDADPLSVDAARANARRNGVDLDVSLARIGDDPLPAADVVLANLTATVLGLLATALPAPAPRALIASGMRPHEADAVAALFAAHGLGESRRVVEDDWATVLLLRS